MRTRKPRGADSVRAGHGRIPFSSFPLPTPLLLPLVLRFSSFVLPLSRFIFNAHLALGKLCVQPRSLHKNIYIYIYHFRTVLAFVNEQMMLSHHRLSEPNLFRIDILCRVIGLLGLRQSANKGARLTSVFRIEFSSLHARERLYNT